MTTTRFRLIAVLGCLVVAPSVGCGGDDGANADAMVISVADAGPPDAPPPPDAFVCVETATRKNCGPGQAGCVDITSDNQNCGGCGVMCPTAGRLCVPGAGDDADAGGTDVAHCECPPTDFLPATVVGLDLSSFGQENVNAIPGTSDLAAIGPFFTNTGTIHTIIATYGGDGGTVTPIGEDIDLSTVTGQVPAFGAGYDIDTGSFGVQIAYVAAAGTLNFDYACTSGAAGTLTNADFQEIAGLMDFTPVDGGCGFHVETLSFSIGDDSECGPADLDAGLDATPPGP